MKCRRISIPIIMACLVFILSSCSDSVTTRALDSIRPEDMTFHQKFLSSPEFLGRNTPSAEQDIASRYIALVAERIGLMPLMPGGSFYQEVPVEATTVATCESGLRLVAEGHERTFSLPRGRDRRPVVRTREGVGRDRLPGLRAQRAAARLGRSGGRRPQGQGRRHPGRDASRRPSAQAGREPQASRRPDGRLARTGRRGGRHDRHGRTGGAARRKGPVVRPTREAQVPRRHHGNGARYPPRGRPAATRRPLSPGRGPPRRGRRDPGMGP